jgi:hypothetical protein
MLELAHAELHVLDGCSFASGDEVMPREQAKKHCYMQGLVQSNTFHSLTRAALNVTRDELTNQSTTHQSTRSSLALQSSLPGSRCFPTVTALSVSPLVTPPSPTVQPSADDQQPPHPNLTSFIEDNTYCQQQRLNCRTCSCH